MVRILHTSDVQLDAPFGFLGGRGTDHRRQLRETFAKIVKLAGEQGYDLLLIAGDLFNDNRPARDTVNFVSRKLGELSIPVCILPGNHDCYDSDSVYRKHSFPANVHTLTERPTYLEFEDLDLIVAGSPLISANDSRPPLQDIIRRDDRRWFVALAHGNLQIPGYIESDARPIAPDEIVACAADYVALGDWHAFADYSQGDVKAFYSGAPEPTALAQSGAGNVASVTLSDDGVEVKPIQVGSTSASTLAIDLSDLSEAEVIALIRAQADPSLMLSVSLTGLKGIDHLIDLEAVHEAVAADFYWVQVTDLSATALDNIDPAEYPETHVIGQYIRMMQEKIAESENEAERHRAEQALQIGFALLRGEEVLR